MSKHRFSGFFGKKLWTNGFSVMDGLGIMTLYGRGGSHGNT